MAPIVSSVCHKYWYCGSSVTYLHISGQLSTVNQELLYGEQHDFQS